MKRGENKLGFLLSQTNFMLLNGLNQENQNVTNSYESNSSFEMGFSIGFPTKNKRMCYHVELRFSQKYGNSNLSFDNNSKVSEYLIQVPFLFQQYLVDADKLVRPYISIGAYTEIPLLQKFYTSQDVQTPSDFVDEYKLSYMKFGFLGEWGANFVIDKNTSFELGLRIGLDLKDLYINVNDNPAYDYSVYSLNFSYLYNF